MWSVDVVRQEPRLFCDGHARVQDSLLAGDWTGGLSFIPTPAGLTVPRAMVGCPKDLPRKVTFSDPFPVSG